MKKTIKILIIILFIFSISVNAKETCIINKGSGHQIGDEISCGTESFYIIENQPDKLRLLAKYNLNVGDIIDYFEVQNDDHNYNEYNYTQVATAKCREEAENKEINAYYLYPMIENINGENRLKGCRTYSKIEEEIVHQDERAVGTKIENGKSVLPLYGIVYMNPNWGYEAIHDGNSSYTYEYDDNNNLILSTTPFEKYLDDYKNELEKQQITVENISLITLSNTIKLLEEISGEEIEVNLEPPTNEDASNYEFLFGKMDIKKYLGNQYKWIYDRTYWLGSGFWGDLNINYQDIHNDYYISNEGMLCAIGRGECKYFQYPIGNGIRPTITINKNIVKYKINTKTDGNGTIEVIDSAFGDDSITFKISSKKGYKLKSLIITTDTGKQIQFNEEKIKNNHDGTISIDNKFIMPYENITIEAKWEIINPKTSNRIIILGMILLILIISLTLIKTKRKIDE